MKTYQYITTSEMVINESGSLQQFYRLTNILSKTRFVHFTAKQDEADILEWRFKYRGNKLALKYDIYNGVTLLFNEKGSKAANKIAVHLSGVK